MNVFLILYMNDIHYFIHNTLTHTHTHVIYNCFACFICIRLHDISLLIHLNIVNVSQKYIDLKSLVDVCIYESMYRPTY